MSSFEFTMPSGGTNYLRSMSSFESIECHLLNLFSLKNEIFTLPYSSLFATKNIVITEAQKYNIVNKV